MYKISYEKCVCFIFLVILAVLSCSGFRIDNLAMTDISKRNSYTSNSLMNPDEFFERLFNVEQQQQQQSDHHHNHHHQQHQHQQQQHRIRHHRQLRAQAHFERPSAAPPTRPGGYPPTTQPSDLAQIPPTLPPTKSIVVRSQRSNQRNRKHHPCQEQDVSRKAFLANTVVVARAESMSSDRRENYTVLFKVLQRIKNSSFPVADHVPLRFSSNKTAINCDNEYDHAPRSLVRAKIEKSKEYILFLNAYGAHNYSVVGTPELRRRKIPNTVLRVANAAFRPKEVKVDRFERVQHATENRNKRLKLVCKVRGFPIPYIYWKRNSTFLHSNFHTRITYKNDVKDWRKSTLVIRSPNAGDWGRYECMARGVDGSQASKELRVERERRPTPTTKRPSTSLPSEKPASGLPCKEDMKRNYCYNGGTCFYESYMGEYACLCAEGYSGNRCEEKSSNQSSEQDESISVSEKSF